MTISSKVSQHMTLSPSMAWLTVFVPALSYYLATRMNVSTLFSHSSLGIVTTDSIQARECSSLQDIFYIRESCSSSSLEQASSFSLRHPLYLILGPEEEENDNDADTSSGLHNIVDTLWKHDSELGRGYLLLSQSYKNGRIWRFEVGGGPIPIGKTLHMEPSGCRSSTYQPCHKEKEDDEEDSSATRHPNSYDNVGSAGLAIDFQSSEEYSSEGKLVVSELGEGRIVRMEESGARTPLVIQVPSLCPPPTTEAAAPYNHRLRNPTSLLYTPFGDLLIGETHTHCDITTTNDNDTTTTTMVVGGIVRVKNAMSIEELPSLKSRQAHSWNSTLNHKQDTEILYRGTGRVIGLALDPSWTGVYVTSIPKNDSSISIHHVTFDMDDDDDDDEVETNENNDAADESGNESSKQQPRGLLDDSTKWVYTANAGADVVADNSSSSSSNNNNNKIGGAIAVDTKGHIYLATTNRILVLDGPNGNLVTTLPVPKTPTSLTLGEDGFLYVSTVNQLYRIRVKHGPVLVPVNLVGKKQTSFAHTLNQ